MGVEGGIEPPLPPDGVGVRVGVRVGVGSGLPPGLVEGPRVGGLLPGGPEGGPLLDGPDGGPFAAAADDRATASRRARIQMAGMQLEFRGRVFLNMKAYSPIVRPGFFLVAQSQKGKSANQL